VASTYDTKIVLGLLRAKALTKFLSRIFDTTSKLHIVRGFRFAMFLRFQVLG
jgi:hypothetical protein